MIGGPLVFHFFAKLCFYVFCIKCQVIKHCVCVLKQSLWCCFLFLSFFSLCVGNQLQEKRQLLTSPRLLTKNNG